MQSRLKKILIPAISAVVGGVVVILALKLSPSLLGKLNAKEFKAYSPTEQLFGDDFFAHSDPFKEMRKMREQMQKQMEAFEDRSAPNSSFSFWLDDKPIANPVNEIGQREDDHFVYYDIQIEDLNSTSLNTEIKDGYLTITGTVEKKNGSDNEDGFMSQSFYKSTFNRSFPLPDYVEHKKMEVIPEKDKVTLKFPKAKT